MADSLLASECDLRPATQSGSATDDIGDAVTNDDLLLPVTVILSDSEQESGSGDPEARNYDEYRTWRRLGREMREAAEAGDKERLLELIPKIVEIDNFDTLHKSEFDFDAFPSPLVGAAMKGHVEMVEMLVTEVNMRVNAVEVGETVGEATALHEAAYHGHHEIVQFLLSHEADRDICAQSRLEGVAHRSGTAEEWAFQNDKDYIQEILRQNVQNNVSVLTDDETEGDFEEGEILAEPQSEEETEENEEDEGLVSAEEDDSTDDGSEDDNGETNDVSTNICNEKDSKIQNEQIESLETKVKKANAILKQIDELTKNADYLDKENLLALTKQLDEMKQQSRKRKRSSEADDHQSISTKMMECIICFSLPPDTIFGCKECDEIICGKCIQSMKRCPTCRKKFKGNDKPKRNRMAERLLKNATTVDVAVESKKE